MRVYIGCFGSGLGHATRMLEIADLLRQRGSAVSFSSSGEVVQFIKRQGYECNGLPLADVRYSKNGGLSLKATLTASPMILARTYRQLSLELANLKRFGADVVLSDSSLATLIAAKILGIRAYVVLNQLSVSAPAKNAGFPSLLLSEGTSTGILKFWRMSDGILLPDLPPPYTISESNLWNGHVTNARYIGFLAKPDSGNEDQASREFAAAGKPRVFWQVSGPQMTRQPLVKKAQEISSALSDDFVFALTEGDPAGSSEPSRFRGGWRYGWCNCSQAYFDSCDVVVSRAGHGTIARAITSSKPSLLIPIPQQTEQEGNAAKAARLGVSVALHQNDLSPKTARRALEALLSEPYQSSSKKLAAIARGYDARRTIVAIVEGATA